MKQLKLAVAALFLILPFAAKADIIYDVDRDIGSGGVVGTITTDGTMGALTDGDFVSWLLTLTEGGDAVTVDSATTGTIHTTGSVFTADATGLWYSFTTNSFGHFQVGFDNGANFWCLATTGHCGLGDDKYEVVSVGNFNNGYQSTTYDAGTKSVRIATARAVPEPGTLALLGLGLVGMAAGRRKKV